MLSAGSAAVAILLGVSGLWGRAGFPSLATTGEVHEVVVLASENGVAARQYIVNQERSKLFEIDDRINSKRQRGEPIPQDWIDQRQRVLDSIENQERARDQLLKRLQK
jgi:hypothetical protein